MAIERMCTLINFRGVLVNNQLSRCHFEQNMITSKPILVLVAILTVLSFKTAKLCMTRLTEIWGDGQVIQILWA